MDPYATHLEGLLYALAAHPGSALELGCGHYSTPLLRAFTRLNGSRFTIMSSDRVWWSRFRDQCDELIHVDDWSGFQLEQDYAVCLLDNEERTSRRFTHLPMLLKKCQAVVVHDAERFGDFRGWDEILTRTPHRWFKKLKPWTVVLQPGLARPRPMPAEAAANSAKRDQ